MRKYVQLCLVLVAALCFILMAFYERKYTKLNHVIEFMQWPAAAFRSTPTVAPQCNIKEDLLPSHPYWTEAATGSYVYSFFLTRNYSMVQIVSLSHIKSEKERIMCSFLHDGVTDVIKSYVRKYPISQSGDWILNILSCPINKDKTHIPINGVSVSSADEPLARTFFSLEQKMNISTVSKLLLVACVKPLTPGFSDTARILEFIFTSRLSGIDRIIFYHRGLGLTVRKLLNEKIYRGMIEVLPFLLPLNAPAELVDSSAFLDCYLRATQYYKATIFQSNLDDFYVLDGPKNFHNAVPKGFSGLLTFKMHLFCLEFPDDIVARTLHFPFITLGKTKRLKEASVGSVLMLESSDSAKSLKMLKHSLDPKQLSKLSSSRALFINDVILSHYAKCGYKKSFKGMVTDTIMLKYKNKLFNELRLYMDV